MNQSYNASNMIPSGSANYGYYVPNAISYQTSQNANDERLAGGFVFPFLLAGVTGAALAPAFWRPNYNRPVYYPYPPAPYPYPPRRWF